MRPRIGRSDIAALSLLTMLITILFFDVLVGIHALYTRDLSQYYFPTKKLLRGIVLGGEFPYWNPYFHAGQPLAANPEYEVFYPFTWLILIPNFEIGFHLLILIHLYIAACSMYALLRSLNASPAASFFGAHAFALGGIILSAVNLLPILFSVAWMPLVLLYARRFLHDGARRDFALAAIALGLQLIVGEPTTVLQTGILLGLYALAARPRVRRVGAVALLSIAALLLAAIQVLPTLDHFSDSIRARGLTFEQVSRWSMPPARLAETFDPHFFGHVRQDDRRPYRGSDLYPGVNVPFYFSIYSGLLITVLGLAGLLSRTRGSVLVLAIAVVSIVLAFGSHTPLLRFLYECGIARSVRFPEKFILLMAFTLIVFGSRMIDRLIEGDRRLRRMGMFIAVGAAVASALGSVSPTIGALRAVIVLILILAVTRVRRPLWIALAGAFAVLDLSPLPFDLVPRLPQAFYREPPAATLQFPRDRHEFRIFHLADWSREHNRRGRVYLREDEGLYWRVRNGLTPMLPAAYGLRTALEGDYDFTALQSTHDFLTAALKLSELRPADWINPIAAMSNVWYVGMYERPEVAVRQARGDVRDLKPVRFLEGRHHPRYYFADQMIPIGDGDDFVSALTDGRASPRAAFVHGSAFPPSRGTVHAWRERANGATLDVEANGRAFLVMSVTAHDYWRISIDGREARAVLTNLTYQGVVVPSGRHVVEMRYRNPLIAVGAVVSIVTLAALASLALRPRPAR